jgi:hypothetical protein
VEDMVLLEDLVHPLEEVPLAEAPLVVLDLMAEAPMVVLDLMEELLLLVEQASLLHLTLEGIGNHCEDIIF